MIDLIIAFFVGIFLGYLLKMERQSPSVEILQNQLEYYEKDIAYYKSLCKWHAERNKHIEEVKEKFERECG